MNSFDDPKFVLVINRVENLNVFCVLSDKLSDLSIIFWTSIKISPSPNSTADNIRKKKVRESKFRLSNTRPIINEAAYKVIHNSSAVKSRWRAVLTFIAILAIKKKNINSIMFKSPILIIYRTNISFIKHSMAKNLVLVEPVSDKFRWFTDKACTIVELTKPGWPTELLNRLVSFPKVTCKAYANTT